ncbi:MAG: cellobiose phosphorylase, partial [Candidatus Omnitrophica bacterium]|nr:cellobiose phosphorylase [Candidatus Omnitrophota bacterium]
LINNFGGVRIDGSNATIIGSGEKPFIADRNAISRVWMDHGAWPFLTLLLYIHQSGDFDILMKEQAYFRDPQLSRAMKKDTSWTEEYGHQLKDKEGHVYEGTILEHILIQNLTQFFNVGEHNIIRLEGADWNDGLDMARKRGESVAFTSFYGGNLLQLADLLERIPQDTITVAEELLLLLDSLGDNPIDYNNLHQKKDVLFNQYFEVVQPHISGQKVELKAKDVAKDL